MTKTLCKGLPFLPRLRLISWIDVYNSRFYRIVRSDLGQSMKSFAMSGPSMARLELMEQLTPRYSDDILYKRPNLFTPLHSGKLHSSASSSKQKGQSVEESWSSSPSSAKHHGNSNQNVFHKDCPLSSGFQQGQIRREDTVSDGLALSIVSAPTSMPIQVDSASLERIITPRNTSLFQQENPQVFSDSVVEESSIKIAKKDENLMKWKRFTCGRAKAYHPRIKNGEDNILGKRVPSEPTQSPVLDKRLFVKGDNSGENLPLYKALATGCDELPPPT